MSKAKKTELNVPPGTKERLDAFLFRAARLPSRSAARKMILEGRGKVDGKARRPSFTLKGGEHLVLELPPRQAGHLLAQDIPLSVSYRDADIMVVNKPAGMVVHPGAGHSRDTLANALAGEFGKKVVGDRPGIVHRLDKDTSGLMVVALRGEAEAVLGAEIKARRVSRRYLALVHGRLTGSGLIDAPQGRDPRHRQRFAVRVAGGRPAQTRFKVVRRCGEASLVECELVTGRTHQIRVHMSYIGHPLLGDKVYGRRDGFPRQMLHAYRLAFSHPQDGRELSFSSPLPKDFREVLRQLGVSVAEIRRIEL